nr:MAG TPA: hypothetical protein [Caudoviricetes sp.]
MMSSSFKSRPPGLFQSPRARQSWYSPAGS